MGSLSILSSLSISRATTRLRIYRRLRRTYSQRTRKCSAEEQKNCVPSYKMMKMLNMNARSRVSLVVGLSWYVSKLPICGVTTATSPCGPTRQRRYKTRLYACTILPWHYQNTHFARLSIFALVFVKSSIPQMYTYSLVFLHFTSPKKV